MEILLDGNEILNKEMLYKTLKNQINSNEFIGNNLDALWEVLSFGYEYIELIIKNRSKLENNLGEYLNKLITLFKELKDTQVKVTLTIE